MVSETKIGGMGRSFETTKWGLVLAAGDGRAMEALIRIYWKPLYFFVRQHGRDVETSKDIVQAFLADLLERGAIVKADPARGRFRTFLRASMTNFMRDWSKTAMRQKRKSSGAMVSLDFARGEKDYELAVAAGEAPERVLDRAWARSLLEDALAQLRGDAAHLEALRMYLSDVDYETIARRTALTVSAAKTAVHRLKEQLRELVVGRIRETVVSARDLKGEIEEFKALLA